MALGVVSLHGIPLSEFALIVFALSGGVDYDGLHLGV